MVQAEKTLSVPEAGRRYFDLSKNASYEAVRLGRMPVIRFGRKIRVPVVALERMLTEAGPTSKTAAQGAGTGGAA